MRRSCSPVSLVSANTMAPLSTSAESHHLWVSALFCDLECPQWRYRVKDLQGALRKVAAGICYRRMRTTGVDFTYTREERGPRNGHTGSGTLRGLLVRSSLRPDATSSEMGQSQYGRFGPTIPFLHDRERQQPWVRHGYLCLARLNIECSSCALVAVDSRRSQPAGTCSLVRNRNRQCVEALDGQARFPGGTTEALIGEAVAVERSCR